MACSAGREDKDGVEGQRCPGRDVLSASDRVENARTRCMPPNTVNRVDSCDVSMGVASVVVMAVDDKGVHRGRGGEGLAKLSRSL